MFTKKHYETIAAEIAFARNAWKNDKERGGIALTAIDSVVTVLCGVFTSDNPRFSRKKFLAACGVTDDA